MATKKKNLSKAEIKRLAFKKKVADYTRFLKDDFDWDYIYILKILVFKLARTRACITHNDIVDDAKKIGREIAKVEDLLTRVINDSYLEDISKDFYAKWGKLQMRKGKSTIDGLTSVSFVFEKETASNSEKIHQEHLRLQRKAEVMKRRDFKKALALMEKQIWGWWD